MALTKSGAYMIFDFTNGKYYLGSSKNIESRLKSHLTLLRSGKRVFRNGQPDYLQNAFTKHGEENFGFTYLEYCNNYKEQEQHYLDVLQPWKREIGYNISEKAIGGNLGEEVNKKLSIISAGRKDSVETRVKKSEAQKGEKAYWYGKRLSEEHREKMSIASQGENNPFYGKKHSIESLSKIRVALSSENNPMYGKHQSLEWIKKRVASRNFTLLRRAALRSLEKQEMMNNA